MIQISQIEFWKTNEHQKHVCFYNNIYTNKIILLNLIGINLKREFHLILILNLILV